MGNTRARPYPHDITSSIIIIFTILLLQVVYWRCSMPAKVYLLMAASASDSLFFAATSRNCCRRGNLHIYLAGIRIHWLKGLEEPCIPHRNVPIEFTGRSTVRPHCCF
jgi:hypothetical protein